MFIYFVVVPITMAITFAMAFGVFHYMDTDIPEGVTEKWNARILDTVLRFNAISVSF